MLEPRGKNKPAINILCSLTAVGICRDQVKQMEVEGAQYEQTKDVVATLLRYDMTPNHMAYYVRGYAMYCAVCDTV